MWRFRIYLEGYAPKADVYVVRGNISKHILNVYSQYKTIGIMCHNKYDMPKNCIVKYMGDNPDEYASTLFSHLRDFDAENVDIIFAEDVDDKGINLAVSNRLYKAAGYKFIEV